MTPAEAARKALDESLEVYLTKRPEINEERQREKERVVAWTVSEIQKGWLPEGSSAELPQMTWHTDYWKGVREAVLAFYGHRCAACGREAEEVHHIRPRELRGKDQPRNLMPLCKECHDEIHRRLDSAMEYAIASTTTVALSMGRMRQTTLEGYE